MMASGPALSHRYHSLLTAAGLLTAAILNDVITPSSATSSSSLWESEGQQTVISSQKTVSASSEIRCVLECHMEENCGSAAFDSTSSTCHLQLTFRALALGDSGTHLKVFFKDTLCKMSDAPTPSNATVSIWRVTSSLVEGDVTCDVDYTPTSDDPPVVSCQPDTGSWTTLPAVPCAQYVWRDDGVVTDMTYLLPRTAHVGWSVCLTAVPTDHTRFSIQLRDSVVNIVLHVAMKTNWVGRFNTTELTYRHNMTWADQQLILEDPNPPFPFRVGQEFSMIIRANSSNTFQVFVDEVFYASYSVLQTVDDLFNVGIFKDVHPLYLNVWC